MLSTAASRTAGFANRFHMPAYFLASLGQQLACLYDGRVRRSAFSSSAFSMTYAHVPLAACLLQLAKYRNTLIQALCLPILCTSG